MKRRKWDAKTKATIVLEGLKGKSAATICQDYQISQAQYYQWRVLSAQACAGRSPHRRGEVRGRCRCGMSDH